MADNIQSDKLGRIQSNIASGFGKYGFIWIVIKIIRCIGLFQTSDLLKTIPVVPFLFFAKLTSAGTFLLIQKPFSSGQKLNKKQWKYIFRHALLGLVSNLLWLSALKLCGPLRTILVYEHGEPILIAMFVGMFSNGRRGNHAKARGSLMFFLGIVCLLFFDNDSTMLTRKPNHPEGTHTSSISHSFYALISSLGVADHKGGVLLLVFTLLLKVACSGYTKRVSAHIGCVKRLHALSTLLSAVLLCPFSILIYLTGSELNIVKSILPLFLAVVLVFVINYYGHLKVSTKLEAVRMARIGYFTMAIFALFFGLQWSQTEGLSSVHHVEEHALSGGVVVSTVFFILASDMLSWPSSKSQKGSFIGYSAEGLPLYRFADDVLQRASKSTVVELFHGLMQRVMRERDSRHIFYFLCINLCFAFVELTYGIWSNSLGLISDSFHMLFDCTALILGLIAAVMAKWKPSRMFSYGYGRVEVLSGFVNGLFLLVVAIFLFHEAFQRLLDPPKIDTDKLMAVSVAGFLVNLVGVFVFSHQHGHGSACNHNHHHHDNTNLKGVYLHILADLLGSVGVIVSSFVIGRWQILVADPICTVLVATLILCTVWPLLRDSSRMLAMCASPELELDINKALSKVSAVDGVISFRFCQVWQHTDNEIIAAVSVYVESHVIEQRIISQVTAILKEHRITSVTVQVEKDNFYQHMSGLMSSADDSRQIYIEAPQSAHKHRKTSDDFESEYTKLV
ncbi:unnamed protein product [Clavelina lepadiformis]|uniref:Proton-coupled zinc antiporter SLC30A5 n=1 Tax=Clavelina lepadiformis TaxID=159417 RepID=A0ABP0GLD6_CLALP